MRKKGNIGSSSEPQIQGITPGLPPHTIDWTCPECAITYEIEPGIRPPCEHYKAGIEKPKTTKPTAQDLKTRTPG
jgi:hypothetical protein